MDASDETTRLIERARDLGCNSGAVYLFDATAGEQLSVITPAIRRYQDHFGRNPVLSGDLLAANDQNGRAYLFDVTTGKEMFAFSYEDFLLRDLLVRGLDDRTLVLDGTYSDDRRAKVFVDTSTGEERFMLDVGDFDFNYVDIYGDRAIVGMYPDAAAIIDVNTGQELVRLDAPAGAEGFGVYVRLSADTATVADSGDKTVYTFDATTGVQTSTTSIDAPSGWAAFDGNYLIAGANTGDAPNIEVTASIYHISTGERVFDFPVVTSRQRGAVVAISGNTAVFVPEDNTGEGIVPGPVYVATFGDITTPGDYNGNGIVEQADLDLVLLHWGEAASPVPDGWTSQLPLGAIDQDELDAVLLNWGNTAAAAGIASAAVPEPSGVLLVGLLAMGALAVVRRGQ